MTTLKILFFFPFEGEGGTEMISFFGQK